jgi:hypothetical protein
LLPTLGIVQCASLQLLQPRAATHPLHDAAPIAPCCPIPAAIMQVYSNKYLQQVGRLRTLGDQLPMVADLSPLIATSNTVQWADFTLYYRDASVYGGRIIGLPLVGVTYALYYRRDILEAAGIKEPPHTWDGRSCNSQIHAVLHVFQPEVREGLAAASVMSMGS